MAKRGEYRKRINISMIILIAVIAFVVLMFVSCTVFFFAGEEPSPSGNVALIKISGLITVEETSVFGTKGTSSEKIVGYIEDADETDSIKAILLDINSGGGGPYASKEIVNALKKTEKPCYAVIREIGTSGAYWIASACDTIIAGEMSITGSISAVASYLEISGLLERYNVTYQRLVSGPYKDIGTPFKELTLDERAVLEKILKEVHDYFVEDVARNRNMPVSEVSRLATGEFYLGVEALELGLVDVIGDMDSAVELIKRDLNLDEVDLAEYKKPKTLLDVFMGISSEQFFFVGRGIGDALVNSNTVSRVDIIT